MLGKIAAIKIPVTGAKELVRCLFLTSLLMGAKSSLLARGFPVGCCALLLLLPWKSYMFKM